MTKVSTIFIIALMILLIHGALNGQDIIGSRGKVGEIELLDGYSFGIVSGKNNQDMITLNDRKYCKLVLFIDYDELNPHLYLKGEKLGNINWIIRNGGSYCGIIDGDNFYISFEIDETTQNDLMVISMVSSIKVIKISAAQQGDARVPASPAR